MSEGTGGVWTAYAFAWRTFRARPFFWFSLMVLIYKGFSGGSVDISHMQTGEAGSAVGEPSARETNWVGFETSKHTETAVQRNDSGVPAAGSSNLRRAQGPRSGRPFAAADRFIASETPPAIW